MQKQVLQALFLFLLNSVGHSQNPFLQKVYVNFDIRDKWEYYRIQRPDVYSSTVPIHSSYGLFSDDTYEKLTYSWIAGVQWTKPFSTELGYTRERYFGAFAVSWPQQAPPLNILVSDIEKSRSFIIRANYKLRYWRRFNVSAGLAYIYSRSSYYKGDFLDSPDSWSVITLDPSTLDTITMYWISTRKRYTELGIRPDFHTIDGRITIEYQPLPWLKGYVGAGYAHGFNKIANFNVTYWFSNEPGRFNTSSAVYGRNIYSCFGLKLYPFYKKEKKQHEKKAALHKTPDN